MLVRLDIPSSSSGEAGFTLIEMLVSMATALLITFAAFGLLQLVSEQSSRATDYLQATQLGNQAMSHIVDELHSACYATGISPVFYESSGTDLIFATAYSTSAEPTAAQVQKHEIKWEEAGGKLVDTEYAAEGTYPTFAFAKTSTKKTTLATHVEKSTTFFKYYKYSTEAQESSESNVGSFTALAAAPSKTEAPTVASVVISFRQLPSDGSKAPGRSVELESQVTFAFGAPIAETKIVNGPCE
ncbi:MAG TPA: prepilin-type N-terminal cleavage/methylation domain-containing protein [Solirubrobacteraceae bacterium]|jgi:prepilin-type N-terminal cleavage/methylation domain-containing protein|nr:prepilin-type N-terminal cleavage/methylation domain-containing protein [Solirubrobacteraceae bacterium]